MSLELPTNMKKRKYEVGDKVKIKSIYEGGGIGEYYYEDSGWDDMHQYTKHGSPYGHARDTVATIVAVLKEGYAVEWYSQKDESDMCLGFRDDALELIVKGDPDGFGTPY